MEIEYKNKIYLFERSIGLTNKMFSEKCWFIARQEPKTTEQFLKAEQNAGIMINMIFLRCRYDTIIENRIYDIIDNDVYFCRYK